MSTHDNAYKHLFSHPQAVRDLLRGFVDEDWVALLDFDTLEKVSGSYVSDDLRDREDDIIWRIRMQGTLGEGAWNAERELEQLIEPVPASLGAYRPRLRYFLMDEGRLSESSLLQSDNAIASLVQIERTLDPMQLAPLVAKLANQLKAPQNTELRRAFAVWINRVVLRRFNPQGDLPETQDLPEVQHMIGERIDIWKEQLLQQGMQQGMQKGTLAGQAQLLRRLLVRRFGVLPAVVEAQISAASLEQIESWFDRSMDATSLGAVFTQH